MDRIEWADLFKTDIAIVDEEHRKLFDMINDIATQLDSGHAEPESIEKSLDELVDFTSQHFVDEEREMVHFQVDKRHQKLQRMEHSSFIYDLNRLRSYADEGDLEDHYEEILKFAASWLIYHTLRTDLKLGMQVREIRSGKSSSDAFEYAETHPLNPAVYQKIIEAVIHLWTESLKRIESLEAELQDKQDTD